MEDNGTGVTINEDKRQGVETFPRPSHPQSPPREANAGDATIQALWPLFIKIQPSLSSLLRDLTDWHASNLLQGPSSGISQETGSDAEKPKSDVPREKGLDAENPKTDVPQEKRLDAEKPKSDILQEKGSDAEKPNSGMIPSLEEINSNKHQETCLGASIPHQESVHIDVEELSSRKSDDRKEDIPLRERVRLRNAALKGDWKDAKQVLKKYPNAVRVPLTAQDETVLHIAALSNHNAFAKEVMKSMTAEDLRLRTDAGKTAFMCAVQSGNLHCAKMMVKMTDTLPLIRNNRDQLPIQRAVLSGRRKMTSYLLSVTPFEDLTPKDHIEIFSLAIIVDMYDIAFYMLRNNPTLPTAKNSTGDTALQYLAEKSPSIGSISVLSYWKRYLHFWFEGTSKEALVHQLVEEFWGQIQLSKKPYQNLLEELLPLGHVAARVGNVGFLSIILQSFPDLILAKDDKEQNIFHIAISNRQESVFNLAYELSTKIFIAYEVDKNKNSLLHLAGQVATQDKLNRISGVALQLQREWLWFKAIERITPPLWRMIPNLEGKSAHHLFIETHEPLRKDGEKWIKDTANNSMIVATLIATIVFAATFTIPGGTNQENGTPIFLENNWFLVFFTSNAIALVSSSTSILNFLSILTSRYDINDFFKSLPRRLVFGLTTLFISIVGMILAFSASCFLMYQSKMTWIPIVIIALGGVPVILFLWQHFGLWFDIIRTTYGSKILFRPREHRLFKRRKMPSSRIDWCRRKVEKLS